MAAGDALVNFYDQIVTLLKDSTRGDLNAFTNDLITFCTRPESGDDYNYPRIEVLPTEGEIGYDTGAKQGLIMRATILILQDRPADTFETHTDKTLALANDVYSELMKNRVVASKWNMLTCSIPKAQDERGTEWIESPDGFSWTIVDVEARLTITPT